MRAAVGRSGLVTTPAPRGDVPAASGVIDLATQPVDSGRFGPPSGRLAAAAPPVPASLPLPSGLTPTGAVRSQRPTPPRVASPTPQPVPDPACETATTTPTPSPLRVPLPDRRPDLAGAGRGRKPSDWTPVVAVVLMVLSAVAGFLMFNR